jgi:hypothetical protein
VLDLVGAGTGVVAQTGLAEVADKQALAAYRERLRDLDEDDALEWCCTEPPRHLRRRPRPVQMSTRMHALAMAAAPGLSEDTHGVDPAQMFTAPGRPPRDRQARTRGWGRRVHLSLGSGPDGGCRPASESGYTRKPSWMIDSATARRAALLLRA